MIAALGAAAAMCRCGDPQSQHKGGKGGCRHCELGCGKFEPDDQAVPVEAPPPSLEELLRAAEREREDLAKAFDEAEEAAPAAVDLMAALKASVDRARLRRENDRPHSQRHGPSPDDEALRRPVESQRDVARAELQAVREAAGQEIADPVDERALELAEQLGEAHRQLEQLRVQTLTPANVDGPPTAAVVYAYDAWSCLRDDGCGARYTVPDPDHPCGRLTPVRVTITHRTEGATTR